MGGGLTIAFGILTLDRNDAYEAAAMAPGATQESVQGIYNEARDFQLLTNIAWISTAVFGQPASSSSSSPIGTL